MSDGVCDPGFDDGNSSGFTFGVSAVLSVAAFPGAMVLGGIEPLEFCDFGVDASLDLEVAAG